MVANISPTDLNTTDLARLAKVERATIYHAVAAHGAWRGLSPRKASNGHFQWPQEEAYYELGLLPAHSDMSMGVRAGVAVLERSESTLTPQMHDVLVTLLDDKIDTRNDNNDAIGTDCVFAAEVVAATLNRIDHTWHQLEPHARKRLLAVLAYIQGATAAAISSFEENCYGE
jgi:hypothetical protein